MCVVQFNMLEREERREAVDLSFFFKASNKKEVKDIAKDLTKGYMKMLSNLN